MTIDNLLQTIASKKRKMFSWSNLRGLILNPKQLTCAAIVLVISELLINLVIIEKVPYTEIDWRAYMQEVEGFLNGTFDYSKLRGDTGPLVYPAGFVYIYSLFYFITSHGENIRLAQYIFLFIYLLLLVSVLRIYVKTKKVPPYVLVITILTSYRIHSIHVLRLFNDPIAILFLYISLNLFLESKWYWGSIFYSLAVSIKMNILLFAPALFFFYLVNLGLKNTFIHIFICGLVQSILGLPFLINEPVAYIKGSFDIGRVFNHTWTVNYRFLDPKLFENTYFHLVLISIHIMLLLLSLPMCINYFQSYCRLKYVQKQVQPQIDAKNVELKKKSNTKVQDRYKNKTIPKDENLSKEQLQFLNSFETLIKKNSHNTPQKSVKNQNEDVKHYSIDFDILSQLFILPMFLVNFIGVVCARSLHYQFYSWYFHTLPYLLWSTNFSIIFRFLILALVELCWNTYPSTDVSSAMLHICHLTILYGVYRKMSLELSVVSKLQ